MSASNSKQDIYHFLVQRKSASILVEPQPDLEDLQKILQVGGTVPDHGGLKPYRFIVIEGDARHAFADAMVNSSEERKGTLDDKMKAKVKAKAFAAPLQIVIVFSPIENGKVAAWEQMAAASCTGYAISLAANALGFETVWKSFGEPGSAMKKLFHLKDQEKVLGWVNIGRDKDPERTPREPLDLNKHALFLK